MGIRNGGGHVPLEAGGSTARVRPVRVPRSLDARLTQAIAQRGVTVSVALREAIEAYVAKVEAEADLTAAPSQEQAA